MTDNPRALADELERHMGEFETAVRAAAELRRLHAEVLDQCRINGMGAERELKLMAEIEELRKTNQLVIDTYTTVIKAVEVWRGEVENDRTLLRKALKILNQCYENLPLIHDKDIEPVIDELKERLK